MTNKKPRKTEWLAARTDPDMDRRVNAYLKASDMTMGDFVRKSAEEYMINHPVKPEPEPIKPGA